MLSDDVACVLRWHNIWGVKGTKVKVENGHFSPWTKNQYPKIESQIPKSQIPKCHLILPFVQNQSSIKTSTYC